MKLSRGDIRVLLAGISAFLVAIGTARFAFTALTPSMLVDFLSVESVGVLSFGNYVGYLAGSLIGIFARSHDAKAALFRLALALSIVTTAPLAFNSNLNIWFASRVAAGVGSALVMTVGSSIVFDLLAHNKSAMGLYFTGAGLSIVATSFVADAASAAGLEWRGAWVLLIACSLPLCAFCLRVLAPKKGASAPKPRGEGVPNTIVIKALILAYLFEGMGFVVQASFLPDIINRVPGLAGFGGYAWYLAGAFAIFGPYLWVRLGAKYGVSEMIILALLLQAVGIALPIFTNDLILNLLTGAIYGNTMMGLTALFMNYGARLAPSSSTAVMSALTAAYSVGTIIAPLYCARLFHIYGSYKPALALTAIFVIAGAVVMITAKISIKRRRYALYQS